MTLRRTAAERAERAVVRAAGALPREVRRRLFGPDLTMNGATLDARIGALMGLGERQGRVFHPDLPVAAVRAGYERMNRALGLDAPGRAAIRDVRFRASGIRARLYRPAAAPRPLPLLVLFHGGGFVIGDVAAYDHAARFFALEGGIAILSVAYRLGPEHRFPRAHEDAFAAYAAAHANAAALGADAARIGVAGDSAGGCIAAAVSALAPERGLPPPRVQLLVYPALDNASEYASRSSFERGVPLTPAAIAWFAAHSRTSEDDPRSPLLSPLFAPVPLRTWTYVLAAGFDPLLDEGRAYAARLRAAGAAVVYDLRPSLAHGFLNIGGVVPEARRALRAAVRATAERLRDA